MEKSLAMMELQSRPYKSVHPDTVENKTRSVYKESREELP
jgi:hypothetical protein